MKRKECRMLAAALVLCMTMTLAPVTTFAGSDGEATESSGSDGGNGGDHNADSSNSSGGESGGSSQSSSSDGGGGSSSQSASSDNGSSGSDQGASPSGGSGDAAQGTPGAPSGDGSSNAGQDAPASGADGSIQSVPAGDGSSTVQADASGAGADGSAMVDASSLGVGAADLNIVAGDGTIVTSPDMTTGAGDIVTDPNAATVEGVVAVNPEVPAADGSGALVPVDPAAFGMDAADLNVLVGDSIVTADGSVLPDGAAADANLIMPVANDVEGVPQEGSAGGEGPEGQEEPPAEETVDLRPAQSETVETLPGTKEQNFPAEPEGESGETGGTGEGTGTEGGTDTGEGTGSGEAGEGEEPGEEEETDQDYTWAYNEETGHFQVTFNIKEGAEGDQTIELSKVMEEVNAYGKQQVEEFLESEEGQKLLDGDWYYATKITFAVDDSGLKFIYNLRTGETTYYEEPGCTMVFDVSLSNGSKHTYTYKDESFTVSTPDLTNDDNTGVIGFDEQELPGEYSNSSMKLQYSKDVSVTGCIESIVDEALKNSKSNWSYYVDANGNKTTSHKKVTILAGTPVYEVNGRYYAQTADGYYYGAWTQTQTKEVDGVRVLKNNSTSRFEIKELKDNGSLAAVMVPYQRGNSSSQWIAKDSVVETWVQTYLRSKWGEDTSTGVALANEIVSYYNTKDGTSYATLAELLEQNETAAKELDQVINPGNLGVTATVSSSKRYDKFYNSILSFNVGSQEDMEKFLAGEDESTAHGHEHGNWVSKGDASRTIGQYMADKLSETDGAWDKANTYFNKLLEAGMSSDKATWVAFTMATNIDGENAGNDYQNSIWSWYSSIVLEQMDGTFELIKTDEDGNVIGDDEGEDQTSFWIWKYEQELDENGESTDVPMYCTYVDPVYETVTDEDGVKVERLVTDGYFTWVKYDPQKNALDFTVTTTNGTLKIDYAMLENIVYYLQEAVAPKGYELDKTIYIICDAETYEQMKNEDGVVIATNPATGVESVAKYMGAIEGGKTLQVNFVNPKTPVPNPTPDPGDGGDDDGDEDHEDPVPVPVPETPETPAVEEVPVEQPVAAPGSHVIQTGDDSHMSLYGSIAAACLVLLAGYTLAMTRKEDWR